MLFVFRVSTALPFLAFGLAVIAVSAQTTPQAPAITVSTRLVQIGVIALRVLVEDPATAEVGSLIIPLSQVK